MIKVKIAPREKGVEFESNPCREMPAFIDGDIKIFNFTILLSQGLRIKVNTQSTVSYWYIIYNLFNLYCFLSFFYKDT